MHLLFHRVDVALYCNGANAIFTWMPRLSACRSPSTSTASNASARSGTPLAHAWYLHLRVAGADLPTRVVTDAARIADYYCERYASIRLYPLRCAGRGSADHRRSMAIGPATRGEYFLYVSRLEPENNGLLVREAFEQLSTSYQLALVGDAPYADEYIRQIRDTHDPRVRLARRDLRAGVSRIAVALLCLCSCDRGGRHASRADRSDGPRRAGTVPRHAENAEVAGGVGIPFTPETLVATCSGRWR